MRDLEGQYAYMADSLWSSPERLRRGFVKKVYGILSLQLILTTLIASPFVLADEYKVRQFVFFNAWLFYLCLVLNVAIMLLFSCVPRLMREVPVNYGLVLLFTVAEGISLGFISSFYSTASVVMAFALVTAVSIALSVYAATSKSDFTKSAFPYLLAVSVVMMGAGLMLMLFPSQIGMSVYAAIGALLFSAYLVFDTQMILGGKNRMQFSLDDYVPAAISLYLDIVSLFIYLLQLFGQRRED